MECPICLNVFNAALHVPLIISCGHSICAPCLNAIYRSPTHFCPLDHIALPPQDAIRPNYALIETLQQQTLTQDSISCCNGHPLEELVTVSSSCIICEKRKNPLWFCIPCQSGVCDKCKNWYDGSRAVIEPGIKCFRGHGLRMTQDAAQFYKRAGKFLCDGCRVETRGASAHCRTCNVDFCVVCIRKLTEVISMSLHLRCFCAQQMVWRFREVCGKCTVCRVTYEKSGCFICSVCKKKFCVGCTYKRFNEKNE